MRKYELNGSEAWSGELGIIGYNTGIPVTPTDVYSGGVEPQPHLRDYDHNGNLKWTSVLGNSTGDPLSIFAGQGGVYVAGSASGTGAFVRKYTFSGDLAWTSVLNHPPDFLCGCKTLGVAGDASGIYVAGYIRISQIRFDAFVRKFDLNGSPLWTVQFGAPDHSSMDSLGISANESGVFLISTTAAANTFVMRYDGNGNSVWSFRTQTSQLPSSQSLPIAASESGLYVGGHLGSEAYIAAFSQSASLILFGLNPPFSFLLAGIIVAVLITGIFFFRRLRRQKMRPSRVGALDRSLPVRD